MRALLSSTLPFAVAIAWSFCFFNASTSATEETVRVTTLTSTFSFFSCSDALSTALFRAVACSTVVS